MPRLPDRVLTTTEPIPFERYGKEFSAPYWMAADGSAVLYHGDVTEQLARLPARSAHMCVTSPPYWWLRDYGTAEWEGGSDACDHKSNYQTRGNIPGTKQATEGGSCPKCGAKRIDMQIGAEPLHDCGTHGQAQCGGCFVCSMVKVFREVRRVLRDDGTCWLNLGDSYGQPSRWGGELDRPCKQKSNVGTHSQHVKENPDTGLPPGNLIGVPWRVALALQHDGWVLRQDIIWYAPNKMPESVTNRCTKSHEHIFLLAKSEDYYYDAEAIKVGAKSKYKSSDFVPDSDKDRTATAATAATAASINGRSDEVKSCDVNKRDVWIVPVHGYSGAHFAVYSPQLIEPCILAGTSERGCCARCGAQYERVIVKSGGVPTEPDLDGRDRSIISNRNGITGSLDGERATTNTIGWCKVCACNCNEVVPALVLDPFMGSGTTAATAIMHGRHGIGIDLNEKYLLKNAIPRIEAAIVGEKVGKKSVAKVLPNGTPLKAKALTFGRKV